MDLAKIQELLKMVSESGVAEVEIEDDDFKLTIRQNAPTVMMQPSAPSYNMPYPSYGMPQGGYAPPAAPPSAPPSQQQHQAPASNPASAPSNATANAAPASANGNAETATAESSDTSASDNDGHVVTAELVGTFYRAPAPDAEPFVSVGDDVQEGDVMCIIEAMKIMNEIECDTAGTIKKILVEDAEPVEFDQPLFVIDPA
jgi:acetyl-CoA carboxylase biotin carboxyl carrier protein